MNKAKLHIHGVFTTFAAYCPGFISLKNASDLEWDMQRDIYRRKSRSYKAVSRRAALIKSSFLDMRAFSWAWMALSPFQVAAWVRGRVSGSSSSAGALAKLILIIVDLWTAWELMKSYEARHGPEQRFQNGTLQGADDSTVQIAGEIPHCRNTQ